MNEKTAPELPKGWVWTKVRDVCDLINGRVFKPSEWSSKGLPIIRIQNLNNINADFNYCDFEVEDKYFVNNEQLLFAWSGTPGTSFGAHIWDRGKAVLNQHIFKVEINEKHLNKSFFMHLINNNIDEYIRKAHGTAGLAHITKNKFKNSIVAIPPLPEQRRIVTRIEELFTQLDAGVGALTKAKAQLTRYRQSVLKSACEGRLVPTEAELARAEGRDYEPADMLLEHIGKERRKQWEAEKKRKGKKSAKYKEPAAPDVSGLPELPEGWCWGSIAQICQHIIDCLHSTPKFIQDGKYCIDTNCIYQGKIIFEKSRFVSEETYYDRVSRMTPQVDDILFAREGTIGTAVIVPPNIELCLGQRMMMFRAANGIIPLYFMWGIQSQIFEKQWKGKVTGSTVPHVNIGDLKLMALSLPPTLEQHRIVAEIERRLSVADEIEKTIDQSLKQAERLRQSILKRAFEGKLVPQDPNDEPASVLLEQILLQKEINEKNSKAKRRKTRGQKTR